MQRASCWQDLPFGVNAQVDTNLIQTDTSGPCLQRGLEKRDRSPQRGAVLRLAVLRLRGRDKVRTKHPYLLFQEMSSLQCVPSVLVVQQPHSANGAAIILKKPNLNVVLAVAVTSEQPRRRGYSHACCDKQLVSNFR